MKIFRWEHVVFRGLIFVSIFAAGVFVIGGIIACIHHYVKFKLRQKKKVTRSLEKCRTTSNLDEEHDNYSIEVHKFLDDCENIDKLCTNSNIYDGRLFPTNCFIQENDKRLKDVHKKSHSCMNNSKQSHNISKNEESPNKGKATFSNILKGDSLEDKVEVINTKFHNETPRKKFRLENENTVNSNRKFEALGLSLTNLEKYHNDYKVFNMSSVKTIQNFSSSNLKVNKSTIMEKQTHAHSPTKINCPKMKEVQTTNDKISEEIHEYSTICAPIRNKPIIRNDKSISRIDLEGDQEDQKLLKTPKDIQTSKNKLIFNCISDITSNKITQCNKNTPILNGSLEENKFNTLLQKFHAAGNKTCNAATQTKNFCSNMLQNETSKTEFSNNTENNNDDVNTSSQTGKHTSAYYNKAYHKNGDKFCIPLKKFTTKRNATSQTDNFTQDLAHELANLVENNLKHCNCCRSSCEQRNKMLQNDHTENISARERNKKQTEILANKPIYDHIQTEKSSCIGDHENEERNYRFWKSLQIHPILENGETETQIPHRRPGNTENHELDTENEEKTFRYWETLQSYPNHDAEYQLPHIKNIENCSKTMKNVRNPQYCNTNSRIKNQNISKRRKLISDAVDITNNYEDNKLGLYANHETINFYTEPLEKLDCFQPQTKIFYTPKNTRNYENQPHPEYKILYKPELNTNNFNRKLHNTQYFPKWSRSNNYQLSSPSLLPFQQKRKSKHISNHCINGCCTTPNFALTENQIHHLSNNRNHGVQHKYTIAENPASPIPLFRCNYPVSHENVITRQCKNRYKLSCLEENAPTNEQFKISDYNSMYMHN